MAPKERLRGSKALSESQISGAHDGVENGVARPRAGLDREYVADATRPLLMVDIDGVISLFGAFANAAADERPAGAFHSIEGIPHFLSSTAATHLLALADLYDVVWASGWEEKADEHLPHLLGLPAGLPFLRFERDVGGRAAPSRAHWKLDAIDAFAAGRALAWIDDAIDAECRAWARGRSGATLLVCTDPERGLTETEAGLLAEWARAQAQG